jgi:quercetin dioxygenase-like cupin family protein
VTTLIESIATQAGQVLAFVVRGTPAPERTTFLTPPETTLQVGYVVYAGGQEIARHMHLPVERHIVGTAEVLVVQRGRCEVDVYAEDRRLVDTRELRQGDVLIALAGGHAFRVLEDTVLLEVKQGPFAGDAASKERF